MVPRFKPEARKANFALVHLIKKIADGKGATEARVALASLLAQHHGSCRSQKRGNSIGLSRPPASNATGNRVADFVKTILVFYFGIETCDMGAGNLQNSLCRALRFSEPRSSRVIEYMGSR
jgi:hypothetical protein